MRLLPHALRCSIPLGDRGESVCGNRELADAHAMNRIHDGVSDGGRREEERWAFLGEELLEYGVFLCAHRMIHGATGIFEELVHGFGERTLHLRKRFDRRTNCFHDPDAIGFLCPTGKWMPFEITGKPDPAGNNDGLRDVGLWGRSR